jgi:hypothetical protein
MLSKRISQSKKVNRLPIKAQIVWTWTIPYLDDYGCYTGDPEDIKTEVFPKNRKISQGDIKKALGIEAETGLIAWYAIEGGKLVQQYQNFDAFQTFKSDRPKISEYPQFQPNNKAMVPVGNQKIPAVGNQKIPEGSLSKVKLSKDNLREDKICHLDFVFLTKEEHSKLVEKFGESRTADLIEELNSGIGSKGYKYKSHYHTILNWARRKDKENPPPKPQVSGETTAQYKERIRKEYEPYLRQKTRAALLDLKKDKGQVWHMAGWLIDEILRGKAAGKEK